MECVLEDVLRVLEDVYEENRWRTQVKMVVLGIWSLFRFVEYDDESLSNIVLQPVISDEPLEGDDKCRVVKFDRTPIMSTYLLAMIVGEYDYVEGRDSDGVLVRVYTPVGKKEQGQFALNVRLLTVV